MPPHRYITIGFTDGLLRPPESTSAAAARREPSFGFGELQLLSATEARWTWHKNQDSLAVPADTVNITRNLQCANQLNWPL